MSTEKHKILCIEDDADTCELLSFLLTGEGCEVETCSRADCLKLAREKKFSAIILDNYFAGLSGVEICREIRSFDRKIPIIFFSGEARATKIEEGLAAGANAYLVKPNDFEKLPKTIEKLISSLAPKAEG